MGAGPPTPADGTPLSSTVCVPVNRCLGQHLARIQITIAFEELLARVTRLRFADVDQAVKWAPGIANGPERLPLTFDRV
jgi:cytochrome P450